MSICRFGDRYPDTLFQQGFHTDDVLTNFSIIRWDTATKRNYRAELCNFRFYWSKQFRFSLVLISTLSVIYLSSFLILFVCAFSFFITSPDGHISQYLKITFGLIGHLYFFLLTYFYIFIIFFLLLCEQYFLFQMLDKQFIMYFSSHLM